MIFFKRGQCEDISCRARDRNQPHSVRREERTEEVMIGQIGQLGKVGQRGQIEQNSHKD